MDRHIYRYFIFITAIIGGASSHYEETYNGQIFILPEDEKIQRPLELALSEAKEWCAKNLPGSTIPRIIEDRHNVSQFIQSAISAKRLNNEENVLVNSIQHSRGNWSWINGHNVKGIDVKMPGWRGDTPSPHNYGYLWREGEYSIHASRQREPRSYICEYANADICNVRINHKCYRMKNVVATWLQARSNCSSNKGNLASLETLNDMTLKVSLKNIFRNESRDNRRDYWVGIQRKLHHLDDKGSEIKFIDWTEIHSNISTNCLCLSVSRELIWIECDCQNKYPFICTRRETNDSFTFAASRRTKSSIQMTSLVHQPSRPTTSTTSMVVSDFTVPGADDSNAYATIGAVVSCVIIVIIIVIAVVIIGRKQRNRPVKTYEAKVITTTDERATYSDIQQPKENQTIASYSASNTTYATIQLTTETNEEFQSNNIVYAELDLPPKA